MKNARKSQCAWNPTAHIDKLTEPPIAFLTKVGNPFPRINPTNQGAKRDEENINQWVNTSPWNTRVFNAQKTVE